MGEYPRAVTFCATCGGHVGVIGSLAERCESLDHDRDDDLWSEADEVRWARAYARDHQHRQRQAQWRAEELAVPLVDRLANCGMTYASDGRPSIVLPSDTTAADALEEILRLQAENRELLEIARGFADHGKCMMSDGPMRWWCDCDSCEWHAAEHAWESFCMKRGL